MLVARGNPGNRDGVYAFTPKQGHLNHGRLAIRTFHPGYPQRECDWSIVILLSENSEVAAAFHRFVNPRRFFHPDAAD